MQDLQPEAPVHTRVSICQQNHFEPSRSSHRAPPCPLQIFFFMDVPCTAGGHVVATQILFQGNWTRQILDARSKFPKAAQTTAFLRRRTSSGFRSRRHRGGARRGFVGNTLHHGPSTAALGHVIREGRREDHALWELYGWPSWTTNVPSCGCPEEHAISAGRGLAVVASQGLAGVSFEQTNCYGIKRLT